MADLRLVTSNPLSEIRNPQSSIWWSSPYLVLLSLSVAWCGLIVGFPWLVHSAHPGPALFASVLFSKICHHDPLRSFSMLGILLPVCSRCTATYLGWLAGLLVVPAAGVSISIGKLKALLLLAGSAILLDVTLDVLALWSNSFLSRSLTGGLFGLTAAMIVAKLVQTASRAEPG